MPSFLKDITPFYGTGERNGDNQTLEEFLEGYDPYKYKTPSCTADAVVFSHREEKGMPTGFKILMVKRSNHPSIGFWALPGGFINLDEDLETTARRELEEETGVKGLAMEQVAAYGAVDRDPRTRVITTAYMAVVREEQVTVKAGDDAADAAWCAIELEEKPDKQREVQNGGEEKHLYQLHLYNKEKRLDTTAYVEERKKGGLIREVSYTVKDGGVIAVDHAAIIVQAFLKLQERM